VFVLQNGKIEMIRGQMRLMTDRATQGDRSLVISKMDDDGSDEPVCGDMKLDLSELYFEKIS
jgi:hypothetical protein